MTLAIEMCHFDHDKIPNMQIIRTKNRNAKNVKPKIAFGILQILSKVVGCGILISAISKSTVLVTKYWRCFRPTYSQSGN